MNTTKNNHLYILIERDLCLILVGAAGAKSLSHDVEPSCPPCLDRNLLKGI